LLSLKTLLKKLTTVTIIFIRKGILNQKKELKAVIR